MKARLFIAMMLIGSASLAQQAGNYWVVETNKFEKGKSIVRIYNQSSVLLHEETINRDIDLYSKRDKKLLNKKLAEYARQQDTTIARTNRKSRRG